MRQLQLFIHPFSASCMMMVPQAMLLASLVSVKSHVKLRNEIIGCEDSHFLIFSKASCAFSIHSNSLLTLLIRDHEVGEHISLDLLCNQVSQN